MSQTFKGLSVIFIMTLNSAWVRIQFLKIISFVTLNMLCNLSVPL